MILPPFSFQALNFCSFSRSAKAKAESAAREKEAEAHLAARLAEADARIRASRDQAMTHVHAVAEETTSAMVAKLTGETPGAGEVGGALENATV